MIVWQFFCRGMAMLLAILLELGMWVAVWFDDQGQGIPRKRRDNR